MREDRIKWNAKYRQKRYPARPSRIVRQFHGLTHGRAALDVAAGNGRNSLFLARNGFSVHAVDISDVGLRKFARRHSAIFPICADFDHFDIAPKRYDLILNINFLNRRLFPHIREGLRPGGVLIFETFLESKNPNVHQPSCRDHLLYKNELLYAFWQLRIVYYREAENLEHDEHTCMASLVAVKEH